MNIGNETELTACLRASARMLSEDTAQAFCAEPFKKVPGSLDRRVRARTAQNGGTMTSRTPVRLLPAAAILCALLIVLAGTVLSVPTIRDALTERLEKLREHLFSADIGDITPGGDLYFTPLPKSTETAADPLSDAPSVPEQPLSSARTEAPEIADPKERILDRMINAPLYYDALKVTYRLEGTDGCTVTSAVDLSAGTAYERLLRDNGAETLRLCDGYIRLDVCPDQLIFGRPDARRGTLSRIDCADAFSVGEDGFPVYTLHPRVTNCSLPDYVVQPANFAVNELKDFTRWSAGEPVWYLGRLCDVASGTLDDYERQRRGSETFSMLIDRETGILMRLSYGSRDAVAVTEITYDRAAMPELDGLSDRIDRIYADAGTSRNRSVTYAAGGALTPALLPAQRALALPDPADLVTWDAEIGIGADSSLKSLTLTVGDPAGTRAGILVITPNAWGYESSFTACPVPDGEFLWCNAVQFTYMLPVLLSTFDVPSGVYPGEPFLREYERKLSALAPDF